MVKTNVCKYALYRFTRREDSTTGRALCARLSLINPVPTRVEGIRREVEYGEFGEKTDTKTNIFGKCAVSILRPTTVIRFIRYGFYGAFVSSFALSVDQRKHIQIDACTRTRITYDFVFFTRTTIRHADKCLR